MDACWWFRCCEESQGRLEEIWLLDLKWNSTNVEIEDHLVVWCFFSRGLTEGKIRVLFAKKLDRVMINKECLCV